MAAKGKKSRKKRKNHSRSASTRAKAAAANKSAARPVRPESKSAADKADQRAGDESVGAPLSDGAPDAAASQEPEAQAQTLEVTEPTQRGRADAGVDASSGAGGASEDGDEIFDLDAAVQETADELGLELTADELIAQVATDAKPAGDEPVSTGVTTEEAVQSLEGKVPDSPTAATVPGQYVEDAPDPSGPVGPPSSAQERARLLAAASAYAEMQDARYRVPTEGRRVARLKGWIALTSFVFAGLLAIAPPELVLPEPSATLVEADRLQGLHAGLLLQAEQVEAFRVRELRLPDSLAEVAARVPGVRFVKSGNRVYQLIGYTSDGRAVVYDSAAPAAEFDAIERAWTNAMGS